MKESIWKDKHSITKDGLTVNCPKCQKSRMSLIKYEEQITGEAREDERYGHPNGAEYQFLGFLKCSNEKCSHIINISGIVQKYIRNSGYDENGNYYEDEFDNYVPHYYYPNIRYFELTSQIPENISKVIDLAFYHYFYDYNASANKVRTAIELILDDIKAPKKRLNNAKKKTVKLNNLHQRIEHFSKKRKGIATLMLANKYIGNDGSHIGEVDKQELLDAFNNLEEIIDKIYIQKSKQLLEKANKLNEIRKNSR